MENSMAAIETSEKIGTLTAEDRAVLKKSSYFYWLLIVVFVALTVFLISEDIESYRRYNIGEVVLMAFFALCTGIAVFVFFSMQSVIGLDLKANRKKIITGPIENKRMGAITNQTDPATGQRDKSVTMVFHLTVNNQEYLAPDDIYLSLKKGDFVQIEIAPESNKILRWVILKDRKPEEPATV